MRTALAALALVLIAGPASATPPNAKQLIRAYDAADAACRGSPGDSGADECERRTRLNSRLNQIGWCYGTKTQSRSDFRWHHCKASSMRADDLEPAGR